MVSKNDKQNQKRLILSNRERRLVVLAATGLTDKQVATHIGIATATVHTHWTRLRLKLGVSSRTQIVALVILRDEETAAAILEEFNRKESLDNVFPTCFLVQMSESSQV